MARDFTMVAPALWESARFCNLGSTEAQLLHLYFLCGPHQTSAGCFRMREGYALADLNWKQAGYRAAKAALLEAALICEDAATSEILVERWFQHNAPTNAKHAAGVHKVICRIESDELRVKAEEAFLNTVHGGALKGSSETGNRLLGTGFMKGSRAPF